MELVVPIRMEPDPVEELDPHPDGDDIDRAWIEFVVNEYDDHAIEEAILIKEALDEDVTVTVVGLDTGHGDLEQTLHMAAAKGADRLQKITDVPEDISTTEAAAVNDPNSVSARPPEARMPLSALWASARAAVVPVGDSTPHAAVTPVASNNTAAALK